MVAFESQGSRRAGLAPEDHGPLSCQDAKQPVQVSLAGRLTAGGTNGNERLTITTGLVLLILLALLGVTILRIRPLLSEHMFLGVLLICPVTLKLASTGYRFIRYYTFEERYRRKGPPAMPLRLLAPIVLVSTVVVFASGVALMLLGPSSRNALLPIHKISFFVWVAATALHVLGHLTDLSRVLIPRSPSGTLLAEVQDSPAGRSGRALALSVTLLAGVVLGILSISQFAPWTHTHIPHH